MFRNRISANMDPKMGPDEEFMMWSGYDSGVLSRLAEDVYSLLGHPVGKALEYLHERKRV